MLQEKPKMSEGDILAKDRRILLSAFRDDALEKLYQVYSKTQKRAGLECFLFAGILFDLFILLLPGGQDVLIYALVSVVLIYKCVIWYRCKSGSPKTPLWGALPHMAWLVTVAEFLFLVVMKSGGPTWRDHLGWAILFVYLFYVTLPIRLRYCVVLSVGTACAYVVLLLLIPKDDANQISQILANCALLVSATILGLLSYFVEEKHQRRAFLETRQSLEMKLVVEEQSAEQEQLLLSVLPEHVAVQMRQDLDSADSQFKKIYMSRHENVSILYADIVGFTAISSTYSAQELVKMLNELFARFDRLADKFHQLRIKILGDCYYCISGAPQERPDHAVLCVHMGLSMVKAIKYVQQTTNSPVDMRVGIHTGAVLAGVLGQRQWQFDVYSKDVELANKMESSGKAGRVHISATTLSFLNGEFEVDAAFGEKREEALRIAGLKTYFIVKVLKPYCSEKKQEDFNGAGVIHDEDSCVIADVTSDSKEDEAFDDSGQVNAAAGNQRHDSKDFKKRLQQELVSRDGHRELAKSTKFLNLAFLKQDVEDAYHRHTEVYSNVILQGFVVVRFFISISQFIALPMGLLNFNSFIGGSAILMIISTCSLAEIIPQEIYCGMWRCCMKINESIWMRKILSAICIIVLTAANIVDTISCSQWDNYTNSNCSFNSSHHLHIIDQYQSCLYPSYYSYFGMLILIVAALPASLSYISKTVLMFVLAFSHCMVNVCVLAPALDCEETRSQWETFTKGKYALSILLLTATIILAFLARHMEQVARVLFLWRSEVEEQRECASDMRRRNEALVYNILPPHVAEHFLGNRKRQHDELYSQSYAEVGVLFASMPNFSDFYSEETVNNQGLECLRFLNEVISDFDALMELPQFQDIIKIKTIGSTYMAASGLNPTKHVKPDDPITVRWANLALLVDFALELKKALQGINEQSFNHFVLKMGINHGPITAGVIGARKPHYDIWGNTVNVASRMESTGKAGCIQVTEDTCEILQHFGYTFEQRGLVAVKGKGQLMTYYLQGKSSTSPRGLVTSPLKPITVDPHLVTLTDIPCSPTLNGCGTLAALTMDLVMEEDGSHGSHTTTSKSDDKTVIECGSGSTGPMDTRSDVFNELDNGGCCCEGTGGDVGKETTESTHLLG